MEENPREGMVTPVTILNPLTNREIDRMVEYARSILQLYAPYLLASSYDNNEPTA